MKTVTTLAAEVADMFVREIRGEATEARLFLKETIDGEVSRHDAAHTDHWVTQMVMDAPDCNLEETYEEVFSALLHIADSDASDFGDLDGQEADIYTGELLAWLMADYGRVSDVDEANKENGGGLDFITAIQYTQSEWRQGVLSHVWETLEAQIEDSDDEDDNSDDEDSE